MFLINAAISTLVQLVVLAVLPFVPYWIYRRIRHWRTFTQCLRRTGLQIGETQYALYGLAFSLVGVAALVTFMHDLEPLTRRGSAQHLFVEPGLDVTSVALALLYGALRTGFAEEVLFRGLIAGSLGRGSL